MPRSAPIVLLLCGCVLVGFIWSAQERAAGGASPVAGFAEVSPPEEQGWDDLPPVRPAADDWPWWRGPSRDNKARPDQTPPAPLEPNGKRGLEVARCRAVVMARPASGETTSSWPRPTTRPRCRYLLCYGGPARRAALADRRLSRRLHALAPQGLHASVTPACDGQRMFAAFMVQDAIEAVALDFEGRIVWQRPAAPFKSMHGYGPSPLVYKSLVIIPADNPGPNFLTALRRDTGKVVWRIRRTDYQSFASPIVGHIAGRDQLLVMGPLEVTSYEPGNGERLWHCEGPTKEHAATAVFDDRTVYASAGYPDKRLCAIRADGSGDVTREPRALAAARRTARLSPRRWCTRACFTS